MSNNEDDFFTNHILPLEFRIRSYIETFARSQDVDDILQSTFEKAWKKISFLMEFQTDKEVEAYVKKISKNIFFNQYKRNQIEFQAHFKFYNNANMLYENAMLISDLLDIIESAEVKKELVAATNKLKPIYKAIIILRFVHCESMKSVAKLLGLKYTTANYQLNKALEELKDMLYRDEFGSSQPTLNKKVGIKSTITRILFLHTNELIFSKIINDIFYN